ncbi:hypothetical protein AAFF_G00253920 [Aldrovandia affinis]|uniref:Uncharacterized protein n=1 Tax=Aldrovandia affinis TaxID=143900 RepID=A0AAD7RCI7_9TELE|nr:hypothetical protein AAFF_G00253920 [Aldrovandia affinis]
MSSDSENASKEECGQGEMVQTNKFSKNLFKSEEPKVKIFTLLTGNTLDYHKTFVERIAAKGLVTEVPGMEDCDVILAFCVNCSRLTTDIDAALQKIPEKPAILVVMHHTWDPKYIVPTHGSSATGKEVLVVDCLFHEKSGILESPTNDEAMEKTQQQLKQHSKNLRSSNTCVKGSDEGMMDSGHDNQDGVATVGSDCAPVANSPAAPGLINPSKSEEPKVKIFTLLTGNTLDYHKTFVDHIAAEGLVTEVPGMEDCDVILAFCVNCSRLTTDIDAALQKIPEKPAILVVMHHTWDPKYIVPTHGSSATGKEVLVVDCLFHEKFGILESLTNDEAMEKTRQQLKQHSKNLGSSNTCVKGSDEGIMDSGHDNQDGVATVGSDSAPVANSPAAPGLINPSKSEEPKVKIFTLLTGNTLDYHKTFVERIAAKGLVTEVPGMEDCDVILAFCVNCSRLTTDIDAALQKIPEKPAILVVMHHTWDPKYIVPTHGSSATGKEPKLAKMVKVYSVLAGDTKDTHKAFIKRIAVTGTVCIDECSAILVFCPVASRAGIDIDEALQKIPDGQAGKMIILVVMHHTIDPNHHVPKIRELRTRNDQPALIVDCLFHEKRGLLRCNCNDNAITCVQKKLKQTQGICSFSCFSCLSCLSWF